MSRSRSDEASLADAIAASGIPLAERPLAYLRAYGVPPRRIRKHLREVAVLRDALARAGDPRTILDAPCGWGRLAAPLIGEGRRVALADRASRRLDLLRRLFRGSAPALLAADARALPFRDASFDLVLSAHLNYHFASREDRRLHLRECLRVARRGVLVSYHAPASPRRWIRAVGGRVRGRPPVAALARGDLRSLAAAAGFVAVAAYPLSRFSGHRYALLLNASTNPVTASGKDSGKGRAP